MEWLIWGRGIFLFLFLCIASAFDLKKRIIPDTVCILIAGLSLIPPEPIRWFGILSAVPFLLAAMLGEGMGGGDVKLMGACGMVLGFFDGILALIMTLSLLLSFHAGKCMVSKVKKAPAGQAYPLAPFLSAGVMLLYCLRF